MWLFPSFFESGDVWWCWVSASKNPKTMMLLHGQVWSPAFWWLLLCLCGFDAATRGLTGHVARFTAGICRPWLVWCCLTSWRCVRAGRNSQPCPWSNGWSILLHTIHPWSPAPGHGGSMVRLSALCGMNRLETSTSWILFSKGGWSQQTSSSTSWKRFFFWTVTSKTTDHLYERFHPVIVVSNCVLCSFFPVDFHCQVFSRRFHRPSLLFSAWPVASLLPGDWVADAWFTSEKKSSVRAVRHCAGWFPYS